MRFPVYQTIYHLKRKRFTTLLNTSGFYTKRRLNCLALPMSHMSYASYYSLAIGA